MKKIFAAILVLILALSAMPFSVFAETHIGCVINCDEYIIEVTGENECAITEYKGNDKIVEIPETIEGLTVTSIGDYAFSKNYYLIGVKIPATVKSIGEGAFFYCYNMSTVTIPDTVKNIGEKAFGFNRRKFDTETCTYTYRADPTFTVYASKNSVGAQFANANNFELNEDEMFNDFANTITLKIPYQWTNFKKIYCHIWDLETGEIYTAWQSKKEKCEVDYNNAYFDANNQLDIALSYDSVYGIIFSTDTGEQTFPAIYTERCMLYTLCTDNTYVCTPNGQVAGLRARWWDGRSYADLSAYENAFGLYIGATFTTMDESTVDETTYDEVLSWGDVNCDGNINVKDATAIQKHIAGLTTLSDSGLILGSFFGKNTPLSVRNATELQKHCAGLKAIAKIGEPAITEVTVERPKGWYRQEMYALSWSDTDNITLLSDRSIYKENDQHAVFYVPIYNKNIAITCNDYTSDPWTIDFYDKDRSGINDYACEVFDESDNNPMFIWICWDDE